MLKYDIAPDVDAFSTNIDDPLDFDVILPLHQAHSTKVRRVPQEICDITGVDALITNKLGMRIGVKTADCVPILLFDQEHLAMAAIHSGWKGTVGNIIEATIKRMIEEFGTNVKEVKAVIGPCIHVRAFEVGEEVYEQFKALKIFEKCGVPAEYMTSITDPTQKKWFIDLPEVCRHQLHEAGIMHKNIEVRPECTYTLHDQFYSARRLGKDFDRQRIITCIRYLTDENKQEIEQQKKRAKILQYRENRKRKLEMIAAGLVKPKKYKPRKKKTTTDNK